MTTSAPSEDDVRSRAYQLWLAGGMAHGRDKEDWIRAKEILVQHERPEADAPPSVAHLVVDGMLTAASLAVNTAASVIGGLFGTPDTTASAPEKPVDSSETGDGPLEDAERRLRVDADKRVRDAAAMVGKAV